MSYMRSLARYGRTSRGVYPKTPGVGVYNIGKGGSVIGTTIKDSMDAVQKRRNRGFIDPMWNGPRAKDMRGTPVYGAKAGFAIATPKSGGAVNIWDSIKYNHGVTPGRRTGAPVMRVLGVMPKKGSGLRRRRRYRRRRGGFIGGLFDGIGGMGLLPKLFGGRKRRRRDDDE